jgi:hypothetical protein
MQTSNLAVGMYAQRISQSEMSHGHRVLDRELSKGSDQVSREALLMAIQYYAFAASHLSWDPEQVGKADAVVRQIYDRFKHCKREDIRYLQDEALPIVGQTFNLDTSIIGEALSQALLLTDTQAADKEHFCGNPACDVRDCKSIGS